jgi:hypothetical protein
MTSSPIPAVRSQYLLDLLAQVPDPRKKRGRRHPLAGLLAVGIAAVIAGSKSFAAIGQWAADAGPEALAALGAVRGAAEESTFRRAFTVVSADVLDRVLGAWLHTRAVRAGGRLVIAIDGKTVRGAKNKDGKAPHLVAALAHGIGAVLGQVAVDAKSNEIPAVRDLLKAFASLAAAVVTIGAMHTQHDTAQVILGRGAGYVMTVKANMPALYRQLKKLPSVPAVSSVGTDHGRRARRTIKAVLAPAWVEFDGAAQGRAAAPHGHEEREEDRRSRLPHHQRPRCRPGHPGRLGPRPLGDRKPPSLGQGRDLSGGQIAGQDGKRASRDGVAAQPGHQPAAPGRPDQHRRRQPPPRPRPAADATAASDRMNDFAGSLLPYPKDARQSLRYVVTSPQPRVSMRAGAYMLLTTHSIRHVCEVTASS